MPLMRTLLSLGDCARELVYGPGDLFLSNDCWRSQKYMIPGTSVDAPLHGIDKEAPLERSRANSGREILSRRERTFCGFTGDELDRPQQPDATDIAYGFLMAEALESCFENASHTCG